MSANIIHTYLFTKLIQQTPRFSQQTTRQRHPRRRPKQPSYTCCGRCEGDGKKSRDRVVFPDDNSYICRAMQQQMRHSASGDYLNIKRRDEFHA